MNKLFIALGVIAVVLLTIYTFSSLSTEKDSSSTSKLSWNSDLNSALQEAKKTNKPLFIDFYANWCSYCKMMDEETYTDPRVQEKLSQNYVLVKIDSDKNPELSKKYKVYGLPTMLILDQDGQEVKRISGYRTPDQLLSQL